MKGRTFNTANLPVCLIDFNYTRDTNTAKFDSSFRHFGESVIFVFRQTKSKFAHGEWRSLSANPANVTDYSHRCWADCDSWRFAAIRGDSRRFVAIHGDLLISDTLARVVCASAGAVAADV